MRFLTTGHKRYYGREAIRKPTRKAHPGVVSRGRDPGCRIRLLHQEADNE